MILPFNQLKTDTTSLTNMGIITRLIGKAANSEVGRRLIGKSAAAAKSVIGKVEKGHEWFKKHLPSVTSKAESAAKDLALSKDPRSSWHHAKDLLDVAEEYGNGHPGEHVLAAVKRVGKRRAVDRHMGGVAVD